MKLLFASSALLLLALSASAQNYKVETSRLLEVSGDVKAKSCNGGCCEGHDGTACVGVRLLDEYGAVLNTGIYDKVSCCDPACPDRQTCGVLLGFTSDGPANSCAGNTTTRFSIAAGSSSSISGNLDLCVSPGGTFLVPFRRAQLGNVVNNSASHGSNCSASDPFNPFNGPGTDTYWGNFLDTCPNPLNPDIVCVPSDCTPGSTGGPPYGVEIVEPYGADIDRWDDPGVTLRWRPTTLLLRPDSYRIVVYGLASVFFDAIISCTTLECSHNVQFPNFAAGYYWWVQAVSQSGAPIGEQSRAGFFNLYPPLARCASLGGSCAEPEQGIPWATCPGATISGSGDCPNWCCADPCSDTTTHDHAGGCGSTDSCGHLFGTPTDPGCAGGQSCGAMGGEYCSGAAGSCPGGYDSLGQSSDCAACCNLVDPCADPATHSHSGSCGSSDSCGHVFGTPSDCWSCGNGVCEGGESASGCADCQGDGYCEPNVEGCGTSPDCPCWMAGTTCSTSGPSGECVDRCSDPAFHNHSGSCGQADECGHPIGTAQECLPSCGAMGGDYCSQTNDWCPGGHGYLGQSYDCASCCQADPCASPYTHDHGGSCGSADSCGHSFGSNEDCGCPGAPTEYDTCWDYVCDTEWSWVPEYCDTCEQQCTTEWSCWTNCEWDYCWDECVPYESCSNNCYSYECGGYWAPSDNNCRWEPYQCNPHQCGY